MNVSRAYQLFSQQREQAGQRHQQQHAFHGVNACRTIGLIHFDGGPPCRTLFLCIVAVHVGFGAALLLYKVVDW